MNVKRLIAVIAAMAFAAILVAGVVTKVTSEGSTVTVVTVVAEVTEVTENTETTEVAGVTEAAVVTEQKKSDKNKHRQTEYDTAYTFMHDLDASRVKIMRVDYINDKMNITDHFTVVDKSVITDVLTAAQNADAKMTVSSRFYDTLDIVEDYNRFSFELDDGTLLNVDMIQVAEGDTFLKTSHIKPDGSEVEPVSKKYCDYKESYAAISKKLVPIIEKNNAANVNEDGGLIIVSFHDDDIKSNVYKATGSGSVRALFYSTDSTKTYETDFAYSLEKQASDGTWSEVKPTDNIVQTNSGTRTIPVVKDKYSRLLVCLDLACYPVLPAGSYRIVKPYWEKGSTDHSQYKAYYNFDMSDNVYTGKKVTASAYCLKSEYPVNSDDIVCQIDYSDGVFTSSQVFDVERKENGEWTSVRKTSIKTNSISTCYGLSFITELEIDRSEFDISKSGEYRVRISVGEITDNDFIDNYDTIYAYFKLV